MAITKASLIDLNGQELILDADADTSITADTDDVLDFKTGGTDRLKISGNNLHLNGGTDARIQLGSGGAGANSTSNDTVHIRGDGDDMKLMAAADGNYIFENNGSEKVRIDSSGNLLVGTTDNNVTNNSGNNPGINIGVAGIKGFMSSARYQGPPFSINRLGNDGDIQLFSKDGSTVGSIGTGASELFIGSNDAYLWTSGNNNAFLPASTVTGGASDGLLDLGSSSRRFDDIYATNGTIQTSDRNEKQDIEELSDAETRVAVAAKGLLRKFRWQSAVEEKGDNARIHFGIIAQDLQDAFTAEGLDASDYAMFCSNTWTDDDGEEQTRLGVRYSELLAFIIAAI